LAPALQAWLRTNGSRLYLPTICVAEIVSGIEKAQRQGASQRAQMLERWLGRILLLYASRTLPLDLAAARAAGILLDRARASGLSPGFADLAIAGIAQANGLVLLTRNLRHFAPLGVAAQDPFANPPN
jgi:hypothetical protein